MSTHIYSALSFRTEKQATVQEKNSSGWLSQKQINPEQLHCRYLNFFLEV